MPVLARRANHRKLFTTSVEPGELVSQSVTACIGQHAVGGDRQIRVASKPIPDLFSYGERIALNFPALRVKWLSHQLSRAGEQQVAWRGVSSIRVGAQQESGFLPVKRPDA